MAKKENKATEPGSKTHNKKSTANSGRTLKHNVDPDTIYFTHARIRPQFTGCNKMIQDTIDEIEKGLTKITEIPFITVIENFEEVYLEPDPKDKPKKNSANKRRNRKSGDDSDEDESVKSATTTKSFYFSLNNRRLFLFKTLKQMGLLNTITVYVKPALEREKIKYQRKNCVIMAKVMSRKEVEEAGEEKPDEDEIEPCSNNVKPSDYTTKAEHPKPVETLTNDITASTTPQAISNQSKEPIKSTTIPE